jgi:hypothetical protein
VLGLDSGVSRLQHQQVFHEETAADEQGERHRDFRDDQAVAYLAGATARARVTFADGRHELARAHPRERPEAAEDPDAECYHRREQQDASVDRDRRRTRQLIARQDNERLQQPERQRDAQQTARPGEQNSLGEQLPRQIAGSRAQREADPELTAPRQAGGEEQVATLAQPMRSTAKTAPSSIRNEGRTAPTTASRYDRTSTP